MIKNDLILLDQYICYLTMTSRPNIILSIILGIIGLVLSDSIQCWSGSNDGLNLGPINAFLANRTIISISHQHALDTGLSYIHYGQDHYWSLCVAYREQDI